MLNNYLLKDAFKNITKLKALDGCFSVKKLEFVIDFDISIPEHKGWVNWCVITFSDKSEKILIRSKGSDYLQIVLVKAIGGLKEIKGVDVSSLDFKYFKFSIFISKTNDFVFCVNSKVLFSENFKSLEYFKDREYGFHFSQTVLSNFDASVNYTSPLFLKVNNDDGNNDVVNNDLKSIGYMDFYEKYVITGIVDSYSFIMFLLNRLNSHEFMLFFKLLDREWVKSNITFLVFQVLLSYKEISELLSCFFYFSDDIDYRWKVLITLRTMKLQFANSQSISSIIGSKKKEIMQVEGRLLSVYNSEKIKVGALSPVKNSAPTFLISSGYFIEEQNNTHVQMLLRLSLFLRKAFCNSKIVLIVTGEHFFELGCLSMWNVRRGSDDLSELWKEKIGGDVEVYLNYTSKKPMTLFNQIVKRVMPNICFVHGSPVEPFYSSRLLGNIPKIYFPSSVELEPRCEVTHVCTPTQYMYDKFIDNGWEKKSLINLQNPFYLLTKQEDYILPSDLFFTKNKLIFASVVGRGIIKQFFSSLDDNKIKCFVDLFENNKDFVWFFIGQKEDETFFINESIASLIRSKRIVFISRVDNNQFDSFCQILDVIIALPNVSSGGNAIYRAILSKTAAVVSHRSDVSRTCIDELVYNDLDSFFNLLNRLSQDESYLEYSLNKSYEKLHGLRDKLVVSWKERLEKLL